MAGLGYAVPGSVIAVGTLVPLGLFDNALDAWMREHFGISTGLLLSGGIAALVFAYLVRFLAVALSAVESGLARIRPSLRDAARVLGARAQALDELAARRGIEGGALRLLAEVSAADGHRRPMLHIVRDVHRLRRRLLHRGGNQ